jgi:hypothetical protein
MCPNARRASDFEGPEKVTGGGGGEWEPIKIPRGNSTYVPKLTQRTYLLTRSIPHSYQKAIGSRNRGSSQLAAERQLNQENKKSSGVEGLSGVNGRSRAEEYQEQRNLPLSRSTHTEERGAGAIEKISSGQ